MISVLVPPKTAVANMFQNRPIILNINKCHFVKGSINIKHLPGIIIGVVDYLMKMTMLRYFEYCGVMT